MLLRTIVTMSTAVNMSIYRKQSSTRIHVVTGE